MPGPQRHLEVLGPLRLDGRATTLPRAQAALLGLLITAPSHFVSYAAMNEVFWPETDFADDEQARRLPGKRTTLANALRRSLGLDKSQLAAVTDNGYRLDTQSVASDWDEVRRALSSGAPLDPNIMRRLWRGDLLEGAGEHPGLTEARLEAAALRERCRLRGIAIVDSSAEVHRGMIESHLASGGLVELPARILVATTPATYHLGIVRSEGLAASIDRIPPRLSIVFKPQQVVLDTATRRYGETSPLGQQYITEHAERRRAFFSGLRAGRLYREVYNEHELKEYFTHGSHSQDSLDAPALAACLREWLNAVRQYEGNYVVALTEQPVPHRYAIFDREIVAFHQTVGRHAETRLGSYFISGIEAVATWTRDFDSLWETTGPERRTVKWIVEWVEAHFADLLVAHPPASSSPAG